VSYYYLVAGLPLLSLDQPVPFTPDEYFLSCEHLLSDSDRTDMQHILEGHPERCRNRLVKEWVARDTQLRSAIARARAARKRVEAYPYIREFSGYDAYSEKVAAEAMSEPNPLAREMNIDRFRWRLLDELSLADPFGAFTLFAFVIKLQMSAQWQKRTKDRGRDRVDELIHTNLQEGNT